MRYSRWLCLLVLSACMSYKVELIGTIQSSERAITITQGGHGLLGRVKSRLRADGWKIVVDGGPEVTKGQTGEQTYLERGVTFRSRYRLDYYVDDGELAVNGDMVYQYSFSVVDNEAGEEVLTMHGRGLGETIADRLINSMRSITR